jgi:hypothetical protein
MRSRGFPLETRKALPGHANGDITTHYSAAEPEELLHAAEKILDPGPWHHAKPDTHADPA